MNLFSIFFYFRDKANIKNICVISSNFQISDFNIIFTILLSNDSNKRYLSHFKKKLKYTNLSYNNIITFKTNFIRLDHQEIPIYRESRSKYQSKKRSVHG